MGGDKCGVAVCSPRNSLIPRRLIDAYPAVPVAIGAAAGVLAVDYPWLWLAAVVLIPAFYILRVGRVSGLFYILAFMATWWHALGLERSMTTDLAFDGRDTTWRGTVESVRRADRSQRCVVSFVSPDTLRCRVMLADVTPHLVEGDVVEIDGSPESMGRYDACPSLRYAVDRSEITSAEMLVMPGDCRIVGRVDGWWYRMQGVRHSLATVVYDSPLAASTSRLLAASVFGGGDVGDERRAAFRSGGVSHLLCVSGFHVCVFAFVVGLLLFPMRLWERFGRMRYVLVFCAVWLYAMATGLQPSVFRAAVMLTVFGMARILQRSAPAFNSLCVAVIILLLVNPLWLYSIGFQLSVMAVIGLMAFADVFNPCSRRHWMYGLCAGVAVPMAASIATAPVLLYHFHTLPLLSVPVNAAVSMVYPVFMVSGCVVALLSWCGLPMELPARVVDALAGFIDAVTGYAADCKWANPDGMYLGAYGLATLCLCIGLLFVVLHSRRWLHRAIAGGCIVLAGAMAFFTGEKVYAGDIVVHGNGHASEIRVRCLGRGFVVPLSSRGRPIGNADAYFFDGGVEPDSVSVMLMDEIYPEVSLTDGVLKAGGRTLFIANGSKRCASDRVDAIVLPARFRGPLDSLALQTSAQLVIIASDMKPDRRDRYASIADSLGLKVCDLRKEVYVAPLR